jgi:hypothetical protein
MPLVSTRGAASAQGFGEFAQSTPPVYIEDVFSTWLYTGNGSTQTINNGIDLAGKGGLVWIKSRNTVVNWHNLVDTVRGPTSRLFSNTTNSALDAPIPSGQFAFNSNGFSLATTDGNFNQTSAGYVSWTFREQPKFFDVVTYTGNGAGPQVINHNLGSAPGCVIVKSVSNTSVWWVWHRGNGGSTDLTGIELNSTSASTFPNAGVASDFTATTFNAGSLINVALNLNPNVNGQTYVAYLFAHNAGGFGLTGTDNVISCGSYTGNGSATGPVVTLGYEPQWVMVKRSSGGTSNWTIFDTMRGMSQTSANLLYPNLEEDEGIGTQGWVVPNATGFQLAIASSAVNASGSTYIYIAIRRGPMKVPTTGTSVFGLNARTGTSANATVTGGAGVTDLAVIKRRNSTTNWVWTPRLAGTGYLSSNATTTETAAGTTILQANPWDVMDGVKVGTTSNLTNESSGTFINYLIDRAPGFMDVVCYTGNGAGAFDPVPFVNHNLGVPFQLVIIKRRNSTSNWGVYCSLLLPIPSDQGLQLNTTAAAGSVLSPLQNYAPSATTFVPEDTYNVNGATYVAYLFASCPGVSRVGGYTGTGATQVIDCGFTAGARFVLIKATSTTGNWLVWDSARGIVSGNDPYLALNSTAAEVTNTDWVDTAATGFELSNAGGNLANSNGVSYIFLAIA